MVRSVPSARRAIRSSNLLRTFRSLRNDERNKKKTNKNKSNLFLLKYKQYSLTKLQ